MVLPQVIQLLRDLDIAFPADLHQCGDRLLQLLLEDVKFYSLVVRAM